MLRGLVPCHGGTTDAPFFAPRFNDAKPCDRRCVSVLLPQRLAETYCRYDSDVDFAHASGWTFLSEDEIVRRHACQKRAFVDLAVRYTGMGRVRVLSCDASATDRVFESDDGGSNGYERMLNAQTRDRMALPTALLEFQTWFAGIQ